MCDNGTTGTYLNRAVWEREEFEMAHVKHFHPI